VQRATSVFLAVGLFFPKFHSANPKLYTGRKSPGAEAESAIPKGQDPYQLALLLQCIGGGAARHSYSYVGRQILKSVNTTGLTLVLTSFPPFFLAFCEGTCTADENI